ncbi:MAG: ATP-binding protein [Syntrophobacter sp.]
MSATRNRKLDSDAICDSLAMRDEEKTKAQLISELQTLRWMLARSSGDSSNLRLQAEPAHEQLPSVEAQPRAFLTGLETSDEHFRAAFDQSPLGSAVVGTDHRFKHANQALCRMLDYSEEELKLLAFSDVIHTEDVPECLDLARELLAGRIGEFSVEKRCIRKDGSTIWASISTTAILDHEGRILHYLSIVSNISGRKLAEQEVGIYKEHLEALVRERTGELGCANRRLELEIKKGKKIEKVILARNRLLRLMGDAGSRKEYLKAVVERIREWSRCVCVGVRMVNELGAIPYDSYTGFSREFWENENEILLCRDNCICTRICRGSPDPEDRPLLTRYGSFRSGDLQRFGAGLSPADLGRFRGACIRSGFQTVAVVPIRYAGVTLGAVHLADRRRNMAPKWLMDLLESGAQLIGEAIHEFNAKDELRYTYETQRVIDSILRLGLEGTDLIDVLNRALELVLSIPGLAMESSGSIFLVEKEPGVLILKARSGLSREVLDDCGRIPFGKCMCGRAAMERRTIYAKGLDDGAHDLRHEEMIPHGHYCTPIIFSGKVLGVMNITLRDRHPYDSKQEHFLTAVANALAGVIERKRIERELAIYTARLERSNRDLEQFAYVASHDLNEPLRKIKAFSGMLICKVQTSPEKEVLDRLMRIEGAAGRMQRLLNDLLVYSRVGTRQRPLERVKLRQIVEEVEGDLWVRINREMGKLIVGDLPEIEADSTQMRQLFQNLVANALKFHGEKPPLVSIYTLTTSPEQCTICVEDNGIGFEETYLDRIFNPFQRLHGRGQYEGSGMGLAICRRIVERHGGTITAKSSPGEGSTFIIELPVMQKTDPPVQPFDISQ